MVMLAALATTINLVMFCHNMDDTGTLPPGTVNVALIGLLMMVSYRFIDPSWWPTAMIWCFQTDAKALTGEPVAVPMC